MPALPTLFISHGSPMTALEPGLTGERLAELAAVLPRPRAIVIASAHWLATAPSVGGAPRMTTIHDFGGFPSALYAMRYEPAGSPELARQVTGLVHAAGLSAHIDPQRGVDHGMWVPLRLMYPQADIPVVPLSIQPRLGPAHQYVLGQALAPLREQGVLLIGSGSITHNLGDFGSGYDAQHEAPYVRPFTDWIAARLAVHDVDALLDYRKRAPFAQHAHPTDEHLLPLFFALGAAGADAEAVATRLDAGIDLGFLAMDIYRFG